MKRALTSSKSVNVSTLKFISSILTKYSTIWINLLTLLFFLVITLLGISLDTSISFLKEDNDFEYRNKMLLLISLLCYTLQGSLHYTKLVFVKIALEDEQKTVSMRQRYTIIVLGIIAVLFLFIQSKIGLSKVNIRFPTFILCTEWIVFFSYSTYKTFCCDDYERSQFISSHLPPILSVGLMGCTSTLFILEDKKLSERIRKVFLRVRENQSLLLMLMVSPTFPIVYSMVLLNIIEEDSLLNSYTLFSIAMKIIYLKLIINCPMQSLLELSNSIIFDERSTASTNPNLDIAKEIRSMIANVAHDLKTPLAGLSSAIELMEISILDSNDEILSDTIGKSASNESDASTKIMTLSNILSNMKHMNSSVYMTINRFLDSSKAVNGIKLVPNYECVHINDTIMAAVGWIRSQHSDQSCIRITQTLLPPE
eukprot:gene17464-24160_t